METAAYNYLKVTLQKREALFLYYNLTTFLRENDARAFSSFMAFKDKTAKDSALMEFVLHIMIVRHKAALKQFMLDMGKSAIASC